MIIGVIGPSTSCEKIQKDIMTISPETQVLLYMREQSPQAIEVIEECEEACDAILFTGLGPMSSVVKRHTPTKPYECISKGLVSLSRVFLDMQKSGHRLDRFSIDVVETEMMEDAFYEMDINPSEIYMNPFSSYDETIYIHWHLKLFQDKKVDAMLTGFVWVYDFMRKQNYPVFYLPTMRSAVREAFTKLESRCALNEARYSGISAEVLRITAASDNPNNYYSDKIDRNKAENHIIEYAQELQASFSGNGRNEYVIFANKGYTKSEENYRLLTALRQKVARTGFHLNVGIGNALTAYQSESNARKALHHSLLSKEYYSYLVDENDNLFGPLGQEESLEYELVSSDATIQKIADATGMSATSIARIQSIIKVKKSNIFDIDQLADCLQVTPRSARRIAARLTEAGYASVCAKESSTGAGRPKSLFELTFL